MTYGAGRYDGISNYIYHSEIDAVSKSGLDLINRSMAHYLAREEREQTAAMAFGAAVHCAVLEQNIFPARYVVAPEIDRRTKAGKDAWADFVLANAGKEIIAEDDMEIIGKIQASIATHPIAGKILTGGQSEVSFVWYDEASGLRCKCRPDYLRDDGIIIDLKTTESAAAEDFMRSAYNYRYHVQAAFYIDGVSAVTGVAHDRFIFVAVEKKPPYNVACYLAYPDFIARGRAAYRKNLARIVEYNNTPEAERWAGYPAVLQDLTLPPWAV